MDQDRDLSTRCKSLRLFLCGDVMCGRGIDQVLAHPCSPEIYEDYIRSAEDYVLLAERANGFIPRRNGPSYVWGAALQQLTRMQPDARIINLETAVTRSGDRVPKGINYRMSPENAACLGDAKIDCCTLANNHVLDWGRAGLRETLATLQKLNIKVAGAGRNGAGGQGTGRAEPGQGTAPPLRVRLALERRPARLGGGRRRPGCQSAFRIIGDKGPAGR